MLSGGLRWKGRKQGERGTVEIKGETSSGDAAVTVVRWHRGFSSAQSLQVSAGFGNKEAVSGVGQARPAAALAGGGSQGLTRGASWSEAV